MSHRAQEKERRRQERVAAQRAATQAARRKRLTQMGMAAAVGAVALVAIVVVALAGGSDNISPEQLATNARAAGCTVSSQPSEGRAHTAGKVRYKTNPPTSGAHNPVAAQDGIYAPGNEPDKENWVHSLEHGRVIFQYRPGTSPADVQKLRGLTFEKLNDSAGYHAMLIRNNTDMTANFAAVAWTKLMTCSSLTPASLDAMRDFRKLYTDKAPEFVP